jgi:hypothetical protein
VFREYHDPVSLLDHMVQQGRLYNFLKVYQKKQEEKFRWDIYIHKLGPLDDRSWDQFNFDLDRAVSAQQEPEPVSEEDLIDTVRNSYKILKNFKMEGGE